MTKRRRQEEQRNYGRCGWHGCEQHAQYPAPKSRSISDEGTKDLIYFCLNHVREYNNAWDFFDGMTQREIERFQKEAMTGHRPTKKIRDYKLSYNPELFDFDMFFHINSGNDNIQIPKLEKDALAVLDLEYPVDLERIKARYKALVKRYHPDINGGDKTAEEKFKVINQAYKTLKNSSVFV